MDALSIKHLLWSNTLPTQIITVVLKIVDEEIEDHNANCFQSFLKIN